MFLPLFFAGRIFDQEKLWLLLAGFVGFSLTASFIYIINDYRDIESDKAHPEKKNRPMASGAVSPTSGLILASVLLLTGLGIGYLLDKGFFFCMVIYVLLNIAYSLKLKQIPILDTSIIATGFVLRIIAGAEIADVPTSKWIILMTFLLALLLGFAKRRDDVLIFNESGRKLRKSIDGYNLDFINLSMVLMAGIVIMSYILYTLSPEVVERWKTENLYLTSFPVILGILRYLQLTFVENRSGNPTRILLKDIIIQSVIAIWIVLFYLIIYMHKIL
jgi:4-hydroxybenzoate polyprenyltransferase